MYCEQCGTKLAEGTKFCTNCGAMTENEKYLVTERKLFRKIGKGKIVFAILAVLLLLILCIGMIWKTRDKEQSQVRNREGEKDAQIYIYDSQDTFYNTKGDIFQASSGLYWHWWNGLGNAVAYEDDYDCVFRLENKGGIVLKETLLDDEASACKIASSGTAVAWLYEEQEGIGKLKVSFDEKSETQLLNERVGKNAYVFSSDGKYILYSGDYENEEHNVLYKGDCQNGKSEKIGVNIKCPVAISANGKGIYYMKSDEKLYYTDGTNEICLSENSVELPFNRFYFNKSYTELLFLDQKGNLIHFTEEDRKIERLKKQQALVLSLDAGYSSHHLNSSDLTYGCCVDVSDFRGGVIYGLGIDGKEVEYSWIDPATGKFLPITIDGENIDSGYSMDNIFWAKKNGNAYKITSGEKLTVECIYDGGDLEQICGDGKNEELFLITSSEIKYYYDGIEKAVLPLEKGTSSRYDFRIKKIFCLAEDGELFIWNPREEESIKIISENVCAWDDDNWWKGHLRYEVANNEINSVYLLMPDESSKFLFSYETEEEQRSE